MLSEIIDDIIERLAAASIFPVYSAFDARSLDRKGSGFFTVVGISSFESSQPIYSPYTVYIPFKTELELSITAPQGSTAEELYNFYDTGIAPVIFDMSGLTCRLSKMSIKTDSSISRLVLGVKLSASGITKIGRSNV